MGFLGNLVKGALNVVVAPLVVVTDVIKGDFDNTDTVVENVVDSVGDAVEDLMEGDIL